MAGEFKMLRDQYEEIAERHRAAVIHGSENEARDLQRQLSIHELRFIHFGLNHWEEELSSRGE